MLYKFDNKTPEIIALMGNRVQLMNFNILSDIRTRALPITPMLNGNLNTNVYVHTFGKSGSITWNSPYAQYQERGMRADGTHVIENYTTPGTGPHFTQESVKKAWEQFEHQWRKVQSAVPGKSK